MPSHFHSARNAAGTNPAKSSSSIAWASAGCGAAPPLPPVGGGGRSAPRREGGGGGGIILAGLWAPPPPRPPAWGGPPPPPLRWGRVESAAPSSSNASISHAAAPPG